MLNQDYPAIISDLKNRVSELEKKAEGLRYPNNLENQDWDNATLLREWSICERTAANYRKNGLKFYKRGGRLYYTPEARESFKNQINSI